MNRPDVWRYFCTRIVQVYTVNCTIITRCLIRESSNHLGQFDADDDWLSAVEREAYLK